MARSHVVGHGLDDAVVEPEGRLEQVFAVARRATAGHHGLGACLAAPVGKEFQPPARRGYGVAVVVVVVVEHQLAAVVEHHYLCGGRPRVDAHHHLFPACRQRCPGHAVGTHAPRPPVVVGIAAEDGIQATRGPSRRDMAAAYEGRQLRQARERPGPGRQGRAVGRHEVASVGYHHVGFRQVEIIYKRLAQGRQKRQRTAAEEHRGLDVATVGQGDHHLHGHGMEHRGGNVGLGHIL